MILVDLSGIIFSALHVDIAGGAEPHKEYIRHLTLNSLRSYNIRLREEFGEMFIIMDSNSWRLQEYEYYKWVRRHTRGNDNNDWDVIFEYLKEIQDELREHFPFPVLQIKDAEADDIIGILATAADEPTCIVSNDKDFVALTSNKYVKQLRPLDKKFYTVPCARRFELDLILSGDRADGIPNVRCPDDFLKAQQLQKDAGEKPMRAPGITAKFKQEAWEIFESDVPKAFEDFLGEEMHTRYLRNKKLISFSEIPEYIVEQTNEAFANVERNNVMKTLNFMISKRMNIMAKCIADFKPNLNLTRSLF